MELITILLEYMLLVYLGFASIYVFIFSLAGFIRRRPIFKNQNNHKKVAVLIPGYKEDGVIIDSAKSALTQNYPLNLFDVIIIADSFDKKTLDELAGLPIILIEVKFKKSTKAKALNKAMELIGNDYDIALILDADNIMETNFIRKIIGAFKKDVKIVQGRRSSKNLNTSFAILDGISEEINNHIFRKGHRALGLSSGLIGSGMAFEYDYFKNLMVDIRAVGGFDKELEFKIFKNRHTIEYLNYAILLDEKIQKSKDFKTQRRRWLSTQQVYLKKYFITGIRELIYHGNIDFFDKLIQMVLPPRILLLGFVGIITCCYLILDLLIVNVTSHVSPVYWYFILANVVLAYLMAIPKKYYTLRTLWAVFSLPKAFLLMFLLLFKLKGANNNFIHTIHKTSLNNKR